MARRRVPSATLTEYVSADGLEACIERFSGARGEAGVVRGDERPSASWALAWLLALKRACGPARAAAELGLSHLGGARLHRLKVEYDRAPQGGRQYARACPSAPSFEDASAAGPTQSIIRRRA